MTLSTVEFGRRAEITPKVMPMIAASVYCVAISRSVAGKRSMIRFRTGAPEMTEVPRSPVSTLPT